MISGLLAGEGQISTEVLSAPVATKKTFYELALDATFWRGLNPELTVTAEGDQVAVEAAKSCEVSTDGLEAAAACLNKHGYFKIDNALDQLLVARLAVAVRRLDKLGWPPLFLAVYDEFWQLLQSCAGPASHVLGTDYKWMPNFWVSYVKPGGDKQGRPPARERAYVGTLAENGFPRTLRLWVPLTDATAENGCMSVLPADLDKAYPQNLKLTVVDEDSLPDVQALPAAAGSIIACNEALLQWMGTTGDDEASPLISIAFTAQTNMSAFEIPLLEPRQLPGFKQRLALIAHMIKRYESRESEITSKATWELVSQLTAFYGPVGRCQCNYCFPEPEQAYLIDALEKPKSFYSGMVEASRLADGIVAARGAGNLNQVEKLTATALKMLGIAGDVDYVEVIESRLFQTASAENNFAGADLESVAESGPQSSFPDKQSPEAEIELYLSTLVKILGPQNPKVKNILSRLLSRGEAWPANNLAYMAPVHRQILHCRESELGRHHSEIADLLEQYGAYLETSNQLDAALAQFRRAVEIRERNKSENVASQLACAHSQYRLGNVYMKKADYVNAEMPFSKALQIMLDNNCGGTLAVHIHHGLGGRLQRTGQRSQAAWHFYRSIELGIPVPSTHVLLRDSALQLGCIYLMDDRIKDAISLFNYNIFPDWWKVSLPPREKGEGVQNVAITASSNPYLSVIEQMRPIFSPPDFCTTSRQVLVRRYSWAVPNDAALKAIAEFAPVVEIAAGSGYWTALLKARGVDIIAYDASPMESGGSEYTVSGTSWTEVLKGDHTVCKEHPKRALMMCWPPESSPMALDALTAYRGNTCIYIGEGRGGKTGSDAFQDALEKDWKKVKTVELFNWHTSTDALHIYKRKTPLK